LLRYHTDLCGGFFAPAVAGPRPRRHCRQELECRSANHRRGAGPRVSTMETLTRFAIPIALAAVTVVLLAGLWNMLRGGSPNTSQLLMRWRVVLQFIALCLVMA